MKTKEILLNLEKLEKNNIFNYQFELVKENDILIANFIGDFNDFNLLKVIFNKIFNNLEKNIKVIINVEKMTHFDSHLFSNISDIWYKLEEIDDYENDNLMAIICDKNEHLIDVMDLLWISLVYKVVKNEKEAIEYFIY